MWGGIPENRLPAHGFLQDVAVCCVFRRERLGFVLDAQHYQRFVSVVAYGPLAFGRHAYDASFLHGERLSVHLELAIPAEEEV